MTVSYPSLIAIPLLMNLAVIALCELYYGWRCRGVHREIRAAGRIYRCARCGRVYIDTRDVPLARCARCGCLNDPIKR